MSAHMFVKTPSAQIAVKVIDTTTRDVFARYANDKTIELSFQRKDIDTAGWTDVEVSIIVQTGDMFIGETRDGEIYMIAKSILNNY